MRVLVALALGLLTLYAAAAVIVFDFSNAAFPNDEENFGAQPVAIGPRPRSFACPATSEGVAWQGREWPFVVFSPVCHWWRIRHGYAPPAEWR